MSKITLHKKYLPLLKSDSRYFIISGGRGSSKSFSITSWLCLMLHFETNHVVLFTRYTMKSAHLSIIPEFTKKIELLELSEWFDVTKTEIVSKKTGSKIIFSGIRTSSGDQTANLKSLEGVTTFILDESEELRDEDNFDKIDLSVRSQLKQNRTILILNPTTKSHFIYQRFFESKGVQGGSNLTKDDVTYIHTTYLDNINNLSASYLKQLEQMKAKNPKKFEHIVMGGWLDKAEGVIFTNWKIGAFNEDLSYGYGMDFGFSIDPTTLVKVAIDSKHKTIYLKECLYEAHLTTTDIYNKVNREVLSNEIIADSAEPRLIAELSRRGLNIKPCVKGAGSIAEGIALLQDYELIVDEDSINIIKELNNYVWSDKKSSTPIDMYNHILDGARYYVSHRLKRTSTYNYH